MTAHRPTSVVADRTSPQVRHFLLTSLLTLMVGALVYDYLVARAGVRHAYREIGRLNDLVLHSPGRHVATSRDVQQAIGRSPSYLYSAGPYMVEVFSWRSGLPFRTHDYYVVYRGRGRKAPLLVHYRFAIPRDALVPVFSLNDITTVGPRRPANVPADERA